MAHSFSRCFGNYKEIHYKRNNERAGLGKPSMKGILHFLTFAQAVFHLDSWCIERISWVKTQTPISCNNWLIQMHAMHRFGKPHAPCLIMSHWSFVTSFLPGQSSTHVGDIRTVQSPDLNPSVVLCFIRAQKPNCIQFRDNEPTYQACLNVLIVTSKYVCYWCSIRM